MLLRVVASRSLAARGLSVTPTLKLRANVPEASTRMFPRTFDCNLKSHKASFSTSAFANGIFGIWNRTEDFKSEILEKMKTENVEKSTNENLWPTDASMSSNDAFSRTAGHEIDLESEKIGGHGDSTTAAPLSSDNSFSGISESREFDLENLEVSNVVEDTNAIASSSDAALTFADYGLGGGILPHKLFQDVLEYMTSTLDMGWIPAVAILTVVLRTLVVPCYVGVRRFSARSHNLFPETWKLTEKIHQAAEERNKFKFSVAQMEYMAHMRKNNLNPLGVLFINLPSMIVFGSMFYGIRQICNVPVPSLVDGGVLWFTNLAVPDPFMILPAVSCLSMSMLIRSGAAQSEMGSAGNIDGVRKVFMWIPIISLPFLIFQPAAMFTFWIVSNMFTFLLMVLFQNPKVLSFFGVPKRVQHDDTVNLNLQKSMDIREVFKQVREKYKESRNNVRNYGEAMKKLKELEKKNEKSKIQGKTKK